MRMRMQMGMRMGIVAPGRFVTHLTQPLLCVHRIHTNIQLFPFANLRKLLSCVPVRLLGPLTTDNPPVHLG